jgi:MFS transporter, SP family, solute carrier family 2 (myo-inositol transporter), member 13
MGPQLFCTLVETDYTYFLGVAGIGALMAGFPADKLGRKVVIIISSIIFTIGTIICAVSFAKWFLLIGRILLGLAIGLSSTIVPIYISESSPANIRGILVTAFHALLVFGQVCANIFGGAFSYVDPVNVG